MEMLGKASQAATEIGLCFNADEKLRQAHLFMPRNESHTSICGKVQSISCAILILEDLLRAHTVDCQKVNDQLAVIEKQLDDVAKSLKGFFPDRVRGQILNVLDFVVMHIAGAIILLSHVFSPLLLTLPGGTTSHPDMAATKKNGFDHLIRKMTSLYDDRLEACKANSEVDKQRMILENVRQDLAEIGKDPQTPFFKELRQALQDFFSADTRQVQDFSYSPAMPGVSWLP